MFIVGKFMHYLCIAVLGNYHGGIQANATAYFGSIHTSAANGTVVFHFRVFIDLEHFNNDIQFINVTLIQNEFAETIFAFSNNQHKRNFPIGKHGGIDAVNTSRVFPEIILLQSRLLVYEDYVIYSYQDGFPLSDMQSPTTIDLDLNMVVLGQNSDNTEEHSTFAIAIIELIKDLYQGIYHCNGSALTLSVCNLANKCPFNVDGIWKISWPITSLNTTISQFCPGGNSTIGTYNKKLRE